MTSWRNCHCYCPDCGVKHVHPVNLDYPARIRKVGELRFIVCCLSCTTKNCSADLRETYRKLHLGLVVKASEHGEYQIPAEVKQKKG